MLKGGNTVLGDAPVAMLVYVGFAFLDGEQDLGLIGVALLQFGDLHITVEVGFGKLVEPLLRGLDLGLEANDVVLLVANDGFCFVQQSDQITGGAFDEHEVALTESLIGVVADILGYGRAEAFQDVSDVRIRLVWHSYLAMRSARIGYPGAAPVGLGTP